jgi:hypothetical protein
VLISVDILRDRATKGDVNAQVALGCMFKRGEHVALDNVEALRWLRAAASQHSAIAICKLGSMYRKGCGLVVDEQEAKRLYCMAAEQNYAPAQFKLGKLVSDRAQAEYWFQKAAANGDSRSQVLIILQIERERERERECVCVCVCGLTYLFDWLVSSIWERCIVMVWECKWIIAKQPSTIEWQPRMVFVKLRFVVAYRILVRNKGTANSQTYVHPPHCTV